MKGFLFAIGLVVIFAGLSFAADTKPIPYKPVKDQAQAIAELEKLGGVVRKVASGSDALDVDLQPCAEVLTDDHLQYLHSIKDVTVLRLKETNITDKGLAHLAKIKTLKRLFLEKTKVTDTGLTHLIDLKELAYLNLYGNAITDKGVDTLLKIPSLKTIVLTETKVTATGFTAIKKGMPDLTMIPDPTKQKAAAEAAWKTAQEAVTNAKAEFEKVQTELQKASPQIKELQAEVDNAVAKFNELTKQNEAAKKELTRVTTQLAEAKAKLEAVQKEAAKDPKDALLKAKLDEQKALMESMQKVAATAKKNSDMLENETNNAKKASDNAKQKLSKINDNKKLTNAKTTLEAAIKLEETTRKLWEEFK